LVTRDPTSEKITRLPLEPIRQADFQEWLDRLQKQYFVFEPIELVADPARETQFPIDE
jgi:hypothetical protein